MLVELRNAKKMRRTAPETHEVLIKSLNRRRRASALEASVIGDERQQLETKKSTNKEAHEHQLSTNCTIHEQSEMKGNDRGRWNSHIKP